ncbi:hypothetical protein E4U43_006228 [Claviceps pusilla]|uniref:Uncharacterized protein n=1 Tax=Claviceps pusilla TaxID=123648 RepID=A0A9P7N3I4_9HYPO|nr:hypothetical protein E4U43_006228 [Claviceps pusilla]
MRCVLSQPTHATTDADTTCASAAEFCRRRRHCYCDLKDSREMMGPPVAALRLLLLGVAPNPRLRAMTSNPEPTALSSSLDSQQLLELASAAAHQAPVSLSLN